MKLITIFIYLLLTLSWIYILYFSFKEIKKENFSIKSLFGILFLILIIDSLRTIIESLYFGSRLASQYGILPKEIFTILSNPIYLFIPKLINAIAAISIITIIFKKWYPQKLEEDKKLLQRLEQKKADNLRLEELNKNLDKIVYQKTKELEQLNAHLEERIKEEVEKNKRNEQTLFQQSKMAAMGEMIQNIAHQWRQPLSVVTTSASAIKLEHEFGILNEEKLHNHIDLIIDTNQHMSQTIEDFQNFFKPTKEITTFECKKLLDKTLSLVDTSFHSNDIEVELNVECICTIQGYYNEYIQVLMNILSNAKDVLKNKEMEYKFIKITLQNDNGACVVKICDNGGGIDEEIIDRIFEPYFTTKHKSQGTGIGLYMSKEIIEKHMDGKIDVQNIEFEHNNKKYKGAQFTIKVNSLCCELQ